MNVTTQVSIDGGPVTVYFDLAAEEAAEWDDEQALEDFCYEHARDHVPPGWDLEYERTSDVEATVTARPPR